MGFEGGIVKGGENTLDLSESYLSGVEGDWSATSFGTFIGLLSPPVGVMVASFPTCQDAFNADAVACCEYVLASC